LPAPTFEEGDKVFLLRANLRTKRPSRKLDHIKVGPFKVKRKISEVNYELALPKTMQIHPVFHVALLEPAPESAALDKQTKVTSDQEYEVEKILDYQEIGGKPRYLVKWENYSDAENTWEPKGNLTKNCSDLLEEFHRQNPTAGKRTSSSATPTKNQENPSQTESQQVQRILMTQMDLSYAQPRDSPTPTPESQQVPFETDHAFDHPTPPTETVTDPHAPKPQQASSAGRGGPRGRLSTVPESPPYGDRSSPLEESQKWDSQAWDKYMEEVEEELQASTQRLYPKSGENDSSTEEDTDDDEMIATATILEELRMNKKADAKALEDLEESQRINAMTPENIRREMELNPQSFTESDKLQLRAFSMHSEQRGEDSKEGSTRHSELEDLQRAQGVDMTTPPRETLEASLCRRSTCDDLRGMVSRKRKHWHLETGAVHSLNPRDGKESENYGYRDEAEERGTKCYKQSHDEDDRGEVMLDGE
jgi:hypothetical protein